MTAFSLSTTDFAWSPIFAVYNSSQSNPNQKDKACDTIGGTCESAAGTIVYAPRFGGTTNISSGYYGIKSSDGSSKFTFQGGTPLSQISCDANNFYVYEYVGSPYNNYYLEARSLSTGTPVWGTQITSGSRQAPILTDNGLIIFSDVNNVRAYKASTGVLQWSASPAIIHTNVQDLTYTVSGFTMTPWSPLSGNKTSGFTLGSTTMIAAASSTQTLVCTQLSSNKIIVIDYTNGNVLLNVACPGPSGGTLSTNIRDPIICGNQVYVVDSSNYLHCLQCN